MIDSLKVKDKVLLHLIAYEWYRDKFEVPMEVSQYGIASAFQVGQDHISYAMKDLKNRGLVEERISHVIGGQRRRKVYFLTEAGMAQAKEMKEKLEQEEVVVKRGDKLESLKIADTYNLLESIPPITEILVNIQNNGVLDLDKLNIKAISAKKAETPEKPRFVEALGDMALPRIFVGREKEIKQINKWLDSEKPRTVVIYGIPGIGKTSLAAKIVMERKGKMNLFWYRFHRWDTQRNFVGAIADFLMDMGKKQLKTYLSTTDEVNLNEVGKILATDLDGSNTLMVFDDFQRVESKIVLFMSMLQEVVESIKGVKMIVVGRQILPFYDRTAVALKKTVAEMQLEGLDENSSRSLLRKLNNAIDDEAFQKIYRLTKGHPLFLELVQNVEDLESQKDIKKYIQDEIFSRLEDKERRLLQAISVYRYPVSSSAFLIDDNIEYDVLNNLVRRSLIQELSYDVYDAHDMIKDFFYRTLPSKLKLKYHGEAAQYYLEIGEEWAIVEAIYHFNRSREYEKAARLAIGHGMNLIRKGLTEGLMAVIEEMPMDQIAEEYWPELILLKAELFTLTGDYDKAMGYYNQAVLLAEKYSNNLVYCEAYRRMAQILTRRGKAEQALEYYNTALERSKKISDVRGIAETYRGMGTIYLSTGEFTRAIELLEKALENAQAIDDLDTVAKSYIDLGTVYSNLGQTEKAIEYLEKALAVLERTGNKYEIAKVMTSLGLAYSSKGDDRTALEYYEEAINLSEEIGDIRQLGSTLSSAAEIYIEQGDFVQASHYLEDAHSIFSKLGEGFMISTIYRQYSHLYRKKGDFENSLVYLNKALATIKKINMPYYTAKLYVDFARLYRDMGKEKEAREFVTKAIEIWKSLGSKSEIAKIKEEMKF